MAHETNELDRRLRRLGEHLEAERTARSSVARAAEATEVAAPHWADDGPGDAWWHREGRSVSAGRSAAVGHLARAAVLLIAVGLIGAVAIGVRAGSRDSLDPAAGGRRGRGTSTTSPATTSPPTSSATVGPPTTSPATTAPTGGTGPTTTSPGTGAAAPRFIRSCGTEAWAPGVTHGCQLPDVAVGDKLLATACNIEGLAITLGDSGSNVWVPLPSFDDGAGRRCQAGEAQVSRGGTLTVTATMAGSASSAVELMVHEVRGLATGTAFDDGGWATGCFPPVGADSASAGTYTSRAAGSYVLGTVWDYNGTGPANFRPGSGFTARVDQIPSGRGLFSQDRVIAATGPFPVPVSIPANGPSCWVAFGGGFKPAPAGSTGGGTTTTTTGGTTTSGSGTSGAGGGTGGGTVQASGLPSAPRLALANWRVAGMAAEGGIPARATVCATIEAAAYGNGTGEASAGINAAVAACPEGQVVQLSAGTFLTNAPVLVSRAITLRGAGMGATTLVKTNGAVPGTYFPADPSEYQPNVIVAGARFPHTVNQGARNLTADASQGTASVTVDSTAGLTVGQFVEVAEDQFGTGSWQPLPDTTTGPNEYRIWAGDRISWARHQPARLYVDDFAEGPVDLTNSALTWFNRGNGYVYGEIKEIAAISGNRITFTSPFADTYRLDHQAQVAVFDAPVPVEAGVEDMTLSGGSAGGLNFLHAARSWARNVEVDQWLGHGIDVEGSFRIEVTGAYVHDGVWPAPGGGGYAIALTNNASEILVTNSITINTNKNIVANAAGAGSVVSYNYFDDAHILYDNDWQEVAANGSHFAGSHHMLFEGNAAPNFDSDFTHGASYSHTVLRNHFSGYSRDIPATQNLRTIGLGYGSWNFSFVGNVLGLPGRMDGWAYDSGPGVVVAQSRNIWQLGYDPTKWDQQADPKAQATAIRVGNFDYLTSNVAWSGQPGALPDSYYLTSRPAFFGSCRWPWVDPAAATDAARLSILPAKARYDAGHPRDTASNPC